MRRGAVTAKPGQKRPARSTGPVCTPATNAPRGEDDENITIATVAVTVGADAAGQLERITLELLTPDSSRFRPADLRRPGRPQRSFDKQIVRDWLDSPEAGWQRRDTDPPPLPGHVVERTRASYIEAYERITGRRWE
jgi:phosphoribosylaminoimidazole-succinocarboxamide synthase